MNGFDTWTSLPYQLQIRRVVYIRLALVEKQLVKTRINWNLFQDGKHKE